MAAVTPDYGLWTIWFSVRHSMFHILPFYKAADSPMLADMGRETVYVLHICEAKWHSHLPPTAPPRGPAPLPAASPASA